MPDGSRRVASAATVTRSATAPGFTVDTGDSLATFGPFDEGDLDREHAADTRAPAAEEAPAPQKKLSLGKRKLALLDKKKGGKKSGKKWGYKEKH